MQKYGSHKPGENVNFTKTAVVITNLCNKTSLDSRNSVSTLHLFEI